MVIQNFDFSNKARILSRNGDHRLPPCLKTPGSVPHWGQHWQQVVIDRRPSHHYLYSSPLLRHPLIGGNDGSEGRESQRYQ